MLARVAVMIRSYHPPLTCRLVLLSKEAGGSKQSVRIDNWSARKLVDFLKEKLEQPASA